MKKILLLPFLFFSGLSFSQDGYEIKVVFKPFKGEYVYLGHYFGKQYPIVDSVKLDENSTGVLKGNKKLPGGIYLIGYPNKTGFFEILIDKDQKFTVLADTGSIRKGAKFESSPENVLFVSYQQNMNTWGSQISELTQKMKGSTGKDSAEISKEIVKLDKQILNYREDLIKDNEGSLLAVLLSSMKEPQVPEEYSHPKTRADSIAAYNYYKSHFWDGVNLWDGRLAFTPFFEPRVDKYFTQLVMPDPDSIIKEIDWMMSYASISEEMTRFLLIKFANRYLNQKYMWEDAVFVHLFEKYFAQKSYPWLTEAGRKTITDRAYSLMANITGKPAADIELKDTAGKMVSLYNIPAAYTVIAIWDPTCGHCKEVIPQLDSAYHARWKSLGLKMFGLAKETDGKKSDWTTFIKDHRLFDWTHVYYSKEEDAARINAGIPGYSQLYDVQSFPTLYLLDQDKRIIGKKLTVNQIDEILAYKTKTNN